MVTPLSCGVIQGRLCVKSAFIRLLVFATHIGTAELHGLDFAGFHVGEELAEVDLALRTPLTGFHHGP
jgi:hypothetical protein